MTGAVDTFLDAVALDRTALAGNSWSGGWALAYAQRHPERVSRLVLLAPSGLDEPDSWTWEMLKLPLMGELVANVAYGRSTVAATVGDLFVHPELANADVVDAMWAPGTFVDNRRALYLLERELDWRVTEEAMSSTDTPTLVVWGDGDQVLDPQQTERFGDLLPGPRSGSCRAAATPSRSTAPSRSPTSWKASSVDDEEAVALVFRSLRTLQEPKALFGWVRTIAVREAIRTATKQRRTTPADLAELPERGDPSSPSTWATSSGGCRPNIAASSCCATWRASTRSARRSTAWPS